MKAMQLNMYVIAWYIKLVSYACSVYPISIRYHFRISKQLEISMRIIAIGNFVLWLVGLDFNESRSLRCVCVGQWKWHDNLQRSGLKLLPFQLFSLPCTPLIPMVTWRETRRDETIHKFIAKTMLWDHARQSWGHIKRSNITLANHALLLLSLSAFFWKYAHVFDMSTKKKTTIVWW